MALVGLGVHLARVARLRRIFLLLRGHLHEVRVRGIGIRDHIIELRKRNLAVAVGVDHLDHHVHLLVRYQFAHTYEYMSDFRRSHISIVVQIYELERRFYFSIGKFRRAYAFRGSLAIQDLIS